MTRPLRIGLLTPDWPAGATPNGIVTSVANLAAGLREIGHDPVILTMGDAVAGTDPEVVAWAPERRLTDRLRARFDADGANRTVKGRAVAEAAGRAGTLDVVLMEESFGWAGETAKRLACPVVVVLHGPWLVHARLHSNDQTAADRRRIAAEAAGIARAAAVLSPSRDVLQAMEESGALTGRPSAVVANAITPHPGPAAVETAGADILFVGRFDRHKGGDTVLAAFAELAAESDTARLTFAGPDRGVLMPDGSLQPVDTALAALPETARARLDYIGPQSGAEVAALRSRHPIALIASRYENLNYTLLEAMAAGQAIVATRVGGPAEVLDDGETALLVPPEDPQAMAAALSRLAQDPDLARRLGRAARARAEADFSPAEIARQTVAFLRQNGLV